jgi:hypothetical protein
MPPRCSVLSPLIPGCRGPSREQLREHRGFRSRPVADACGAPVICGQGPIGRLDRAGAVSTFGVS